MQSMTLAAAVLAVCALGVLCALIATAAVTP